MDFVYGECLGHLEGTEATVRYAYAFGSACLLPVLLLLLLGPERVFHWPACEHLGAPRDKRKQSTEAAGHKNLCRRRIARRLDSRQRLHDGAFLAELMAARRHQVPGARACETRWERWRVQPLSFLLSFQESSGTESSSLQHSCSA